MVHLERGETEASRKCVQSWFDLVDKSPSQLAQRPTVYYKFFLGLVDFKEGRIDDAKSKLKQMELLLPEIEQAYKARLTAKPSRIIRSSLNSGSTPIQASPKSKTPKPASPPFNNGVRLS